MSDRHLASLEFFGRELIDGLVSMIDGCGGREGRATRHRVSLVVDPSNEPSEGGNSISCNARVQRDPEFGVTANIRYNNNNNNNNM